MKQLDLYDFRGGLCDNVLNERMADNELRTADNCWWKNGLEKRAGVTMYAQGSLTSANTIQGFHRVYVATDTAWHTLLAIDDGSTTLFFGGSTTAHTSLDSSYTWTTGKKVEFDSMDGEVIAVNGTDKPALYSCDHQLVGRVL
jgi:hypothetical protein